MPKSSKPRKPRRAKPLSDRPTLLRARAIFAPLRDGIDAIRRSGEVVIDASGVPQLQHWDGERYSFPIPLEAWAGCWERVNAARGWCLPTDGLRALAAKLRADVGLELADLDIAAADLDAQQAAFLRLPRRELAALMATEEAAILADQLGLSE